MSAPVVLSTIPAPSATGIVLGSKIRITFDQPIDAATVNSSTFALTGPGQTAQIDADELIKTNVTARSGREYITGTFAWPSTSVVEFTPARPFRPGVTYQVLLAGGNSALAVSVIKNPNGEKLATSYRFQFTTGTLDLAEPPLQSPLAAEKPTLDPSDIQVLPRPLLNNDLGAVVEIVFPDELDLSSLDPASAGPLSETFGSTVFGGLDTDSNPFNDIVVTLDPIINDPQVPPPSNLEYSLSVQGNVLRVLLKGLP